MKKFSAESAEDISSSRAGVLWWMSEAQPPNENPIDAVVEDRLRARLEFFAAATHDLKTPLTSLTLWMDAVASLHARSKHGTDPETSELMDRALTHMQALVRRAVHVVDDLLDVVRLEAGRPLPFAPSQVDLVDLVRQWLQEHPADTDHLVELESEEPAVWGCWDADRLARLVENLVGNGMKYSPPGTSITVRIRKHDADGQRRAVLEVEDRGVGIPAADLPHLFEPFYRAGNITPSVAGTGLGLWACRTLVELHQGTIAVASREGGGTRVTVRLPM